MKEITRTDWSALPVGYLSPTQIWSYISCPYCYYLERVEKVPKPMSAHLMIGRQAHAALSHMRSIVTDPNVAAGNDWILQQALEVGSEAFDHIILDAAETDEDGDRLPVEIELTKKFTNIGEAKDMGVKLIRYALPQIAQYDAAAGIAAYEARVWHMGKSFYGYPHIFEKLSADEQADAIAEAEEQSVAGVKPCFPFPVKGYLDVLYANDVLKDAKTASKNGSPDNLAALQLLMYGMPFHDAGEDKKLGWDVMIKTKNPNFAVYWLNGDQMPTAEHYEYARWRVLSAADAICRGDFPPNDGSLFCKYEHGLPRGERAAMDFPEVA